MEIRDRLAGPEKHHLVYGGSRSGKTFVLCYALATRAIKAPGSRHAIFRKHGVAVKQSIGRDTFAKMMGLAYPKCPFKFHEQDGVIILGNESEIWLAGLDDKERVDKILGKEFASVYFNEASEIALGSYLVGQTRLAQQARQTDGRMLPLRDYVDLNPTTRIHWTYRLWVDGINPDGEKAVDRGNYTISVANPTDNLPNLSADYIAELEALPDRQKRRFFLGEYLADAEHALWRRDMFRRVQELPELRRVVVAVDPATSNDTGSDETGIVCCAVDGGGNGYVLEDASGRYRPEEWAKRVIALYDFWGADRVVAEVNQGGDMVESTIRAHRPDVPYTAVRATRGKAVRAEPVAALYERRKVYHLDACDELESQMCAFTTDFDRKAQGYSPDRVDALVWGFTDLFPSMTRRATPAAPILRPMGTMA